jgi:uncharacterized protein YciI
VFVLVVDYLAPLDRVDELRPAHVEYLERHYAAGLFLVSGRQDPPAGGVIVTADADRAEIERIAATDPYVTEGAARYTIIEFAPRQVADSMRGALEAAGVALPTAGA